MGKGYLLRMSRFRIWLALTQKRVVGLFVQFTRGKLEKRQGNFQTKYEQKHIRSITFKSKEINFKSKELIMQQDT